jgi:hypothetical protein
VCADRPACEKIYNGSYALLASDEGSKVAYVQPANSTIPCLKPDDAENANQYEPSTDEDASATNAEAGTNDGTVVAIVLVLLLAAVAAVVVAKKVYAPVENPKLRPSGVEDEETKMAAGAVEADAPFVKGDFWQIEETDTELNPVGRVYQRKVLPPRPANVTSGLVDSEIDTEDEDDSAGNYNITLQALNQTADGANMVKLLSHTDPANASTMLPAGMYPPMSPGMDLGAHQGVLLNPSYGAMTPGATGSTLPGLDMSALNLAQQAAPLPSLDLSSLGGAGGAAPTTGGGNDDEEDTKL